MTAFVAECRREWKRLGVPDLLADEMALDLDADLVEAQADGVSAAEFLGESDPRRFAATLASERGLIAEPAPPPRTRRRWMWVVAGLVALLLIAWILTVVGLFAAATVSVHTSVSPPHPTRAFALPDLTGLKACRARRIALAAGLKVPRIPSSRCDSIVVGQRPGPHTMIPFRQRKRITVTLRLRRARS